MPKIIPDVFLQAAEKVFSGRKEFACVALDNTDESGCSSVFFRTLFMEGNDATFFDAHMRHFPYGFAERVDSHHMRELRVMALCLAAAIAAEGDIS